MPSGNATFTYTGDLESETVQGETFPHGEPTETHDNGIISALRDRDDFEEAGDAPPKAKAKKAKADAE